MQPISDHLYCLARRLGSQDCQARARHEQGGRSFAKVLQQREKRCNANLSPTRKTLMLSPGRVIQDNQQAVLLGTLLVTAALALVGTSPRHLLTTSAAAWTCIWAYARFRSGLSSTGESQGRVLSWAAGVLLALACVCERAVEGGRHIYWAKVRRSAPRVHIMNIG